MLMQSYLELHARLIKGAKAERPHAMLFKQHVVLTMVEIVNSRREWLSNEQIANALDKKGYKPALVLDITSECILWNSRDKADCDEIDLTYREHAGFNIPPITPTLDQAIELVGAAYDPVGDLISRRRADPRRWQSLKQIVKDRGVGTSDGLAAFDAPTISKLLRDTGKRQVWENARGKFGSPTRTTREKSASGSNRGVDPGGNVTS
ncbi:hypothetical protein [Magnetospirillum sp. XM-1]|uniref:hypothetical protein n=1 Tax=Magnetospirillum sp. XM-1 TaxID=1663591 RepID=UPI0012E33084|nr:hypothetical protein [Magnetospirillum sp. XM-1]